MNANKYKSGMVYNSGCGSSTSSVPSSSVRGHSTPRASTNYNSMSTSNGKKSPSVSLYQPALSAANGSNVEFGATVTKDANGASVYQTSFYSKERVHQAPCKGGSFEDYLKRKYKAMVPKQYTPEEYKAASSHYYRVTVSRKVVNRMVGLSDSDDDNGYCSAY